jgi:serine/threonine protein kinase/Tol biopolymer transport system component
MTVNRGTKLGPYEIQDPLGAGGMGEVYKARDTRLDRTVAIKVLPAKVAANAEARQRLEREARAVSSLNHPHICTLYDIGQQDGLDYLVLEYLEGETLSSRLKQGSLPVETALRYAVEIAGALDRAHRQGVVHRDLKPGNIMLTRSGAKLLDFGLAKIKESAKGGGADATAALTRDLTSPGAILGTFQYMSPEQLEGKEADGRSDIFAFGAVLFEMLTGRKTFAGNSQASLIASILSAQPPPVSSVQALSPHALDRVVRTCLAKDPDERWQSAGDLARELEWIATKEPTTVPARAGSPVVRIAAIVAAVAVLAALAVSWLHFRERAPEQRSFRFTVPTQAKLAKALALSPDGAKLAFVGQNAEGKSMLWVRPLDKLDARPLPGTENAEWPFWSPDSRQIAFFDKYYQGHIKKIDAAGGQAQTICETPGGEGGDWGEDGTIIFSSFKDFAIYRVSAAGGTPVRITDPAATGGNDFYPSFLPDGKHFLYFRGSKFVPFKQRGPQSLMLGSIGSPEAKPVLETNYRALYAPASNLGNAPGRLLFIRDGVLMAQEMDPASLQSRGEAVRVADALATDVEFGFADFAVSKNGVLALNTAEYQHELVWLDRAGKQLAPGIPVTEYAHPTLSPNGKQAIFEQPDVKSGHSRLWKLDVDRNEATLFEDEGGLPVFFPDGSAVAFRCNAADKTAFCRKAAGGAGSTEVLWESGNGKTPVDFSRDGRLLSYIDQTKGRQLWILPLTGDRKPFQFYKSEYLQRPGVFSPDGKWIAYTSNETGEYNVYVQPFPATADKWKVSAQGGAQPRWRGDGRELFYRTEDGKMMAVTVKTAGGFEAAAPHMLFQSSTDPLYPNLGIAYAVTADGQRFLVNTAMDESRVSPITIITNWTAGWK